ncbi:cyclin-dependent kinase regulatory subunit protein [Cardiosporidium cionae]|uniref:Cyclin-dependent kinases regulatory subunit n=1 Tax=Cardiosporidium cionae TaxID=476202 RepID=A0ABQ7J8R1_9APIC|nr:cyclin-dependent kinase regulatory subunit protein [Cardiosporidium cionae]|eukprot:KAF8820386.1 cyclin-dependent kinase regulatory subunit protein [Cardiosporidium cionae]
MMAVNNCELIVDKGRPLTFLPIDVAIDKVVNCEFIKSEIKQYPNKFTQYGEVNYSPRYRDDRYIYRHVILTYDVRRMAENLANRSPDGLLTEEQFIHVLGIDLSPGWEHFMRFKGRLRELILRRPLPEDEKHDGAPREGDEVTEESDDSKPEVDEKKVKSKKLAPRKKRESKKVNLALKRRKAKL